MGTLRHYTPAPEEWIMERALTLYRTTIGKKAIMAASGVILFGYVLGHLAGNLNLYAGPEAINEYAAWLRTQPQLLWGTRVLLLLSFGAHIAAATQLWLGKRKARPQAYRDRKDLVTNYAARTMYWSGPILLLFLLFHLAHLTFGWVSPYDFDPSNVYNNIVFGFQTWWVSAIYITGQLALGLHLYHGVWAMFGSVGATHPKYNPWRRRLAAGAAIILVAGNISFPIAVMAGWVEPTTQVFHYPELG
jgi:succinate dehydrogenase / fumarate reductase, cytochrome b subunit